MLFLSLNTSEAQQIETDYIEALNKSTKEKKPMLILFTNGSTQSSTSLRFQDNFLNNPALVSLKTNYVLLEVDCNSINDPSDMSTMYCNRLTNIYNKERQFPAVIALNKHKEIKGELQTNFSTGKMNTYFKFLQTQ